jgi:type I restriction enzyme S subunit
VFYVKDESVVLPEFLNLHIKRDEFARHCDYIGLGSAREYCRFANIADFDIELPPIEVQEEIVEADRLIKQSIRLNNQMIQHLEATAQALYRKTFVDNIDKENLPEGWRMGTLEDLGEIVGGATPSTNNPELWCDDGISWLSPADLSKKSCKFISKGAKDITELGYSSCSTKLLPKGSILFSSRAPIGLMAITKKELCTNQGFKSIIPKKEFGTGYVYYYLLSIKDKIAEENTGSTFDEVSGQTMKEYPAVLPSKQVTDGFSELLRPILYNQSIKEQENEKLTELQSLLLAKMGQ